VLKIASLNLILLSTYQCQRQEKQAVIGVNLKCQ